MDDREEWQERVREVRVARHDDDDDDDIICHLLFQMTYKILYDFKLISWLSF